MMTPPVQHRQAEATELTRTYTAEIEGIQHKCSEEVRGLTEELEREQERCRKLEQQVEESTEYVKEVRERQAELAEIVKGMPAVKALEEKVVALEEELKTVLDVPAPLVASLQTEIETLQTALAEKERELSRPVPTIPVAAPPAPDLVCSLQAEVALLQTRLMEKERDHASRPVAIHIPKPAPVTPYAVPNVHTPRAHQQVLDAVERYRSEVQKLGDEVSVGKKHESLSRQVDSNNTVIAHLEAQLDAALRTSGELEGKASGLEMALSNAQAQLMAAKADQEHAVGTLRGVEASLEKALHEKQLVEMQNRTLEDRMQVRIEEAEVLQGHLALSQRTLCEKQQQFEAEKNEYLKCTDRLQEVVETVGTERDVLGKLVGTLEGELKEERRMADENGTRWVESETSLKVLKYEKEEMLLKTQEADYAMTQLTSANAAIQDELSAMRDSLAEVCESESHLKTRIISLLEERDASLQDLDSLKLAYNDLEREAPVIAPPNTLASELSNITSSSPWILSQLKSLQDGLDQTHLTREELQAKTAYLVDLIAMAVS
eukprot:TRINITY_DN11340_c0_g1_i3.p1 TRINITY_DN11340_c0_g1~~TRINITY_DN11340_c0_g1_i3.p1  ORF type:complete len:548 (+),score=157.18 TRINITY_DN11340_c0_g1_i3:1438-3081(+)